MSEKSITRKQAERFRRAKNEPSERRSLGGGCSGHKILESTDEGEYGIRDFGVPIEDPGLYAREEHR